MSHDPLSLLNWDAVRVMPLLYLCAFGTWTVGIATIFPPGGLIVRSEDLCQSNLMQVPVFDFSFRGDGTVGDLQKSALFTMNDVAEY
jgi:hypothetical protein